MSLGCHSDIIIYLRDVIKEDYDVIKGSHNGDCDVKVRHCSVTIWHCKILIGLKRPQNRMVLSRWDILMSSSGIVIS